MLCQSVLTSNVPVYKDLTSLTLWILALYDGFMKNWNIYYVLYNKVLFKVVLIDGILFICLFSQHNGLSHSTIIVVVRNMVYTRYKIRFEVLVVWTSGCRGLTWNISNARQLWNIPASNSKYQVSKYKTCLTVDGSACELQKVEPSATFHKWSDSARTVVSAKHTLFAQARK